VWLKIAKKGSAIETVSYAEALDVAICYGWIDGQKASFDERHWLQRFTPRRPRSKWSEVNRQKATELVMRRELEKNHRALEFFSKLDSRNRYAILYQIQDAKKPETRARRIEKYVAMLAEQKKLYP
jgi:uncharacterized protein YdeI (YjbR/CyaY-like superfamily)